MDPSCPNFGLRVRKTSRSWFIRPWENGKRVRKDLGPAWVPGRAPAVNAKALTLKAARAKAADLLQLHADGTLLRPRIVLPETGVLANELTPATMTVANLATAYLAFHKQRPGQSDPKKWSASWYQDCRAYLEDLVIPAFGADTLAKDITRRHVRDLVERYATRAPVAANRLFAVIRKMFRWASRRDYLDGAPMVAEVDQPTDETDRRRDRVLSTDEIRRFWIALDKTARTNPQAGRERAIVDVWRLRFTTAQRENQIRAIRWTWIDFEKKTVEFPARVMKRKGKQPPHLLPLGPLALQVLKRRRAFADPTDLLVFGTRTATTQVPGLTRGAPLELPDFQGKDVRRTATTLMAEHGVSDFDISRVLNHARKVDEGVTEIYNKYKYLPEKTRALETLDRVLSAILHPTRKRKNVVVQLKRA
jgi:integrase